MINNKYALISVAIIALVVVSINMSSSNDIDAEN